MKKTSLLLAIALVSVAISSTAQTSKEILDQLSAKAKAYKSITADFTSSLVNPKTNQTTSQSGSIKIKGSKYYVSMGDYQIWCDGKTVWNYSKKDNSVTIDNLADVKDGGFDPSEMFTIWEKDFKHEMKNTNLTVDGVACYQIQLNPNNPKNKSYHTITMYVDKAKMEVTKVEVKTRENATITYKIKNFKTTQDLPDTDFTFVTSKHPGCEVVDNREP
ncbi:MAG: LolA family protein [Flavobacteriales bacterium]